MGRLDEADLSVKLSKAEEARRLEGGQRRQDLRLRLAGLKGDGRLGRPVCALFEGWDASGKGGAIKRLVAPLDLRHVRVSQFAAPSYEVAVEDMLARTDTGWAPWVVVPAENKSYARVFVMERVIEAMRAAHRGRTTVPR